MSTAETPSSPAPSTSSSDVPSQSRKSIIPVGLSQLSSSALPNPVDKLQQLVSSGVNLAVDTLSSLTVETASITKEVVQHHLDYAQSQLNRIVYPNNPHTFYKHLLEAASNYQQWSAAATILDEIEGKSAWKADPVSDLYDYKLIQDRLESLRTARETGDLTNLIFLLRTSLSRNLGDMGNPNLYSKTHIGTKHLIEEYISEVVKCLNLVCMSEMPDFPAKTKMEFFLNTRQSFGRSALLLSGGATLSLHHVGVCKTLFEAKLLPRIISGASGGSIIAAFVCTHTDEEFEKLLNPSNLNLDIFERPNENGLLHKLNRLLKNGVLFDVEVLTNRMKDFFGDITFQEAYNRTRRILNITVSSSTVYEMPRLLNFLTSPNVYIWSAVAASCSVPFVYKSAPLMAKDKAGKPVAWNPSGHRWIDGSVESDLPMQKLSELFNVNHFIVCQVNPHVVPFLHKGLVKSFPRRVCEGLLSFASSELNLRCNQLRELGILPELLYRAQSIVSQRYMGDITIIPNIHISDYMKIVSNPTPESILAATLKGEKATWPKVSIMQNHLQIEIALDEMLYQCRLQSLDMPKSLHKQLLTSDQSSAQSSSSTLPRTSKNHPQLKRDFSLSKLIPVGWNRSPKKNKKFYGSGQSGTEMSASEDEVNLHRNVGTKPGRNGNANESGQNVNLEVDRGAEADVENSGIENEGDFEAEPENESEGEILSNATSTAQRPLVFLPLDEEDDTQLDDQIDEASAPHYKQVKSFSDMSHAVSSSQYDHNSRYTGAGHRNYFLNVEAESNSNSPIRKNKSMADAQSLMNSWAMRFRSADNQSESGDESVEDYGQYDEEYGTPENTAATPNFTVTEENEALEEDVSLHHDAIRSPAGADISRSSSFPRSTSRSRSRSRSPTSRLSPTRHGHIRTSSAPFTPTKPWVQTDDSQSQSESQSRSSQVDLSQSEQELVSPLPQFTSGSRRTSPTRNQSRRDSDSSTEGGSATYKLGHIRANLFE